WASPKSRHECKGGAGPPFQNPPSGILGAPSAPPFGTRGGAWRSREAGLRRPGGALASGDTLAAPPPSRGRLGGGPEMTTAAYETVIVERRGAVGLVTLTRPDRRNAYIGRMGQEIHQAFAELEADEAVRAIVVTGAGRDFCVGADLEPGGRNFT